MSIQRLVEGIDYRRVAHPKYKYQLLRMKRYNGTCLQGITLDHEYVNIKDTIIEIRKGYMWDGVSGFIDLDSMLGGSLVHDAMYQMLRADLLEPHHRSTADQLFKTIIKRDGTSKLLSWIAHTAVRALGGRHAA